ncbi:MAG TPA: ATP synthase F1 subunit gamma [Polyangia bacterium]|jgi:F-type H+-transporting ATPase subunit gamma|nr:ATP synthase F1 subunit gamma [Polyangia bacterium]
MPSLKHIRTQIASKKSTQKITRAMKLVAASRLRRAQDSIVAARPYANALAEAIAEVALRAGAESHPLLDRRTPERITLLLLTSDRGLAGGFNANVFRVTQRFINERKQATPPAREIVLEIVGKKGRDYYRRRRQVITRETPAPTAETATQIAREMAQIVSHAFREGRTDAVFLVYNEFKSAVQQRVVVEPLLPIIGADLPTTSHTTHVSTAGALDFIYEPSKGKLLDSLLPLYLESQIYRGLLESIASELGARMTAMDSATNNAKEMIANLTLQYNRARQAAITKELMEIVSGAEALKG